MKTYKTSQRDTIQTIVKAITLATHDANIRTNMRIAAMGKGVIILPDTGNDMTEKEVLKALGISKTSNSRYTSIKVNTFGQPQETEKTKVDIDCHGTIKKWLLTPEQLRLLQALNDEDFLDPELIYSINKTDYEEV